ncbi:hypothetical protein [Candidatus Binatus sp.]|uniref:hypothetical protein n=1 Tax=Candidatus Binatus sp. TaxID=2811406 RepID=UPI00272A9C4B|nr:hypothetical protein [Candidatus Binatus sp.]
MLITASLTTAIFLTIAPAQIPAPMPAQHAGAALSENSPALQPPEILLVQTERAVPAPATAEPDDQNAEPNQDNDQNDQQDTAAQDQRQNPDQQNAANDESPVMPPPAPAEPPAEAEMPPMPVYPPINPDR